MSARPLPPDADAAEPSGNPAGVTPPVGSESVGRPAIGDEERLLADSSPVGTSARPPGLPVEASPSLPTETSRRAAGHRWPVRLRWFASQLLVVVVGILVALALNAWWAQRVDAHRERAYLRQLDADLAKTESSIAGYDRFLRPVDSTASLIVRAYRMPTPPPTDSLAAWLLIGSRFGVPRPVLGTVEALVATGDLGLIQDDSLRTEIVAYLEYNRALLSSQEAVGEVWRQAFGRVSARVDFPDLSAAGSEPATLDSLALRNPYFEFPVGGRRRPFPFDAAVLLRDREVYEALWTMNSAKRNLAQLRLEMAERAQRLRSLVRASLDA